MAKELLEKAKQVMSLLNDGGIELQAKEGETLVEEPEIAQWVEYVLNGEFDVLEERMAEFVPLVVKRFLSGVAHALTRRMDDLQQIKNITIKTLKRLLNVADSPKGKKQGWNDKLLGETIVSFLQILVLAGRIPEEQAEDFVTSVLDALEQDEDETDVDEVVTESEEIDDSEREDVLDVVDVEEKEEDIDREKVTGAVFADWLASTFENYMPPEDIFAFDRELADEVEPKAEGFIRYLLTKEDVDIDAEFAPLVEFFRKVASEGEEEVSEEEMTRLIKDCIIDAYCLLLAKAVFKEYSKLDSKERIRNFAGRLKLWLKRLKEREAEPPEVVEGEEDNTVDVEPFDEIPESDEEVEMRSGDKFTIFVNTVLDTLITSLYNIATEHNALKSERVSKIKKKVEELASIVGIDVEDLPLYPLLPKMRKLFALSVKRAVKRLLV